MSVGFAARRRDDATLNCMVLRSFVNMKPLPTGFLAGWQPLFSILWFFSNILFKLLVFLSSYSIFFLHCSICGPKFSLLHTSPTLL